MLKFQFSKLVRDKIIDQQVASGAKPYFRKLGVDEHKQALVDKVIEEAKEIIYATPEELAAEIADVQQAIDDLKELYGVAGKDIMKMQAAKRHKSGAFKAGLYIEYVEVADNNPWIEYYRKNADRYPEMT